MTEPAAEIKDAEGDDEEFVDHFVAVRMLPDGRLGFPLWIGAHVSVQLLSLALWVALFGLSLLFAAGIGALHLGALFQISDEDAEFAMEFAPVAWRALAAAIVLGLALVAALWAMLTVAARKLPSDFRFAGTPARRPPRRETARQTRREAAARARRSGWIGFFVGFALCTAVGAVIVAVVLPSAAPWEEGISLLEHLGRLLLTALFGFCAIAAGAGIFILGWLLLMTAGFLRAALASRLLPSRARVKVVVDATPAPPPRLPRRAEPGETPSPSLLAYLFADRILEPDGALGLAAPVPCTDRQVEAADLAAVLFAVAFWSLRERGAVRLELGRRRLLVGRRRLEVTRIRAESRVSLEGAVMDMPNTDPDALVDEDTSGKPGPLGNVRDVICAWFKTTCEDPEWKVVSMVLQEAAELGLASQDGEQERHRLHCDAVTAERAAFDAFAARWRRFEEGEAAICSALRRECASGIRWTRSYPEVSGLIRSTVTMALWLRGRSSRPWPQHSEDAEARALGV